MELRGSEFPTTDFCQPCGVLTCLLHCLALHELCRPSGRREAIAARRGTPKVLLLNGSHDRETSMRSGSGGGMTAVDIVHAVSSGAQLAVLHRHDAVTFEPPAAPVRCCNELHISRP